MSHQLRLRQVCLFFVAFTPVLRFFTLPSILAGSAAEDMWLCSILSVAVDFLTLIPLIILFKKTDKDFYTLLKERFGDALAKTVYVLYAAFFVIKSLMPIAEQKDYIELTLYNTFPSLLNFAPLFGIIFYFAIKHLRVIGRAADLIWLPTIIGFVVLFGLSVSSIDFGAVLPIGARKAVSIVSGSLKSLNWFGDGAYLLFFVGNFKWEKRGALKICLSFAVSGILTVLFSFAFYGIFKSIAFRQNFALTEMSKYSNVVDTLGRFDYIGIFLILLSSFFSVSLPVFFATHAICVAFGVKRKYIPSLIITTFIFALVCIFGEYVYSLRILVTEKLPVMFLIFGNIIPAASPLLLIKRKRTINETI